MSAVVIIAIAAAITGAALWFATRGSRRHPEDLNSHVGDGVVEPRGRRPADAAAEPMGVEGPGQPGIREPD